MGTGEDKKIGDYIWLRNALGVYQIKSDPFIFKSNRLATKKEVDQFLDKNLN